MEKCPECNKDYNGYCKQCNSSHFRDNFKKWTSGDDNIDNLIRESQLNASSIFNFLEWIEYSKFENIEHIADGGFGKVYKAIWKDGTITSKKDEIKNIYYQWDVGRSEWIRYGETTVAVKQYRSGMNMSSNICYILQ